jgi:hypothetical protein
VSDDFKDLEARLRRRKSLDWVDPDLEAAADAIGTLRADATLWRAVVTAYRDAKEWRDIATAPEKPMMVVYCSKWSPRSQEIPDQAFELGYWDGSSWYYLALGHEKFERFDDADDDRPTHYMPLPPAPAIP